MMLKVVFCLLKKQCGNTRGRCRWLLKGNVRGCCLHPAFPMKDQLSVMQFLKYVVCATFCIKAGTPETEMFLPVFIVLPQAAAVASVLLLPDALAFIS